MEIKEIGNILTRHFGDRCIVDLKKPNEDIEILLTDSRNSYRAEESMFFAIRSQGGNNGHKYITDLYNKGVRNFVVEYLPEDLEVVDWINIFIVPDSVEALMQIGGETRKRAKEVVAITGSRGKTTLKEMIFQMMNPYKNISRSPRSFNSRIGVPLSLWQITPDSDIALIEAGISQRGEMIRLSEIIKPDTVILTNIGLAHSNGFSSQKEKAYEKSLIASSEGVETIIYPMDSELIREAVEKLGEGKRHIRWSLKSSSAELYLELKDSGKGGDPQKQLEYWWEGERHEVDVAINKDYDIENMAGAIAFMLKEGFTHSVIKERIENLERIHTRLKVSEGINGCTVILDSYTSDISSLIPAIDFTRRRKISSQKFTLIISDLQHEGVDTSGTYKEIAELIKEKSIERFIGIGTTISEYSSLFPKGSAFYSDTDSFLREISASDFNDEIVLIKGAPDFRFEKIFEQLEARKHETVLEVNLDAMLRNYNYFRSKVSSEVGIIAMVKASGYGAGSHEIAKTLQDAGVAYLAVAALDEGIDLRNNGVNIPIMVMNPKTANYKYLFKNKLEPVVYSMPMLKVLIEETKKYKIGDYPIHIKLDTGMHRMGFLEAELQELKKLLQQAKNIRVASIFSHLATADCLDMDWFTEQQLKTFERMSSELMEATGKNVKRHILNSAGIIRFPQYAYDLVRLGIGLYGANTLPPSIEEPLAVVSTLRTVIICIREIEKDETIGYGRRGLAVRKSRIATLPLGYADGINRKFGNGALKVVVNGKVAPTIGNICMDATMIDVTDIDCKEGDSVEIFGEKNSLQSLADTLETIPYEILTSVSPRVKRVYYRE